MTCCWCWCCYSADAEGGSPHKAKAAKAAKAKPVKKGGAKKKKAGSDDESASGGDSPIEKVDLKEEGIDHSNIISGKRQRKVVNYAAFDKDSVDSDDSEADRRPAPKKRANRDDDD